MKTNTNHCGFKVIEKSTGKTKIATPAFNRLGNLRMWVDGTFYNDKDFIKNFTKIIKEEN